MIYLQRLGSVIFWLGLGGLVIICCCIMLTAFGLLAPKYSESIPTIIQLCTAYMVAGLGLRRRDESQSS